VGCGFRNQNIAMMPEEQNQNIAMMPEEILEQSCSKLTLKAE
jgi:hypothetical protein